MVAGINIQTDESNLTKISFIPLASHPTASASHTQIYYKSGSGVGWYILPPAGSPTRLATEADIPTPSDPTVHASTSAPTTADNVAAGYPLGTTWVKTDDNSSWVYVSGVSTAIWIKVSDAGLINHTPDVHIAAVDPTVSEDYDVGFRPGQLWLNTSAATVWICQDAALGAAIWMKVANNASVNHMPDYVTVARLPTEEDDYDVGNPEGRLFKNSATGEWFMSRDATNSAAKWAQINGPLYSELTVSNPPTATELTTEWPLNIGIPFYQVYINNAGADLSFYLCTWDGANWSVVTSTLAV